MVLGGRRGGYLCLGGVGALGDQIRDREEEGESRLCGGERGLWERGRTLLEEERGFVRRMKGCYDWTERVFV